MNISYYLIIFELFISYEDRKISLHLRADIYACLIITILGIECRRAIFVLYCT